MHFDLIIVGGGPAGLSLARAARGLSVALVAQARPNADSSPGPYDARVYAISPGNAGFLREIGAWQELPEDRITPVHAMRIFGDRNGASMEFDAYRAGAAELAWTVEDGLLQQALWRSLQGRDGVEVFAPAECLDLTPKDDLVALSLADGRELTGALVVGADGAASFVRARSGVEAVTREYGQAAVVANFDCEKPHSNIAYQWFQNGPVMALLPLPGRRVSMIWSLPAEEASRVSRLDPEELCSAAENASHRQLGSLSLLTAPRSYPLRRLSARRMVAPRAALVGDAAHVVHPLAGQGLNLGLQDVRELVAVVQARGPVRDPGDPRLLRRYERARAEPILAMDFAIDGLFRLFGARGPAAARIRNAGLNLTDRVPVLKNILIRHAMG